MQTAFLTWLPIAVGIVLGTVIRSVVFVIGGTKTSGAFASILCVGVGIAAAGLWLRSSKENPTWLGALALSATWVLLSVILRAAWLGIVLGAGWPGVTGDYAVRDGQPWAIALVFIAVVPLLLGLSGRRTEDSG